jgi:hypothetical protein
MSIVGAHCANDVLFSKWSMSCPPLTSHSESPCLLCAGSQATKSSSCRSPPQSCHNSQPRLCAQGANDVISRKPRGGDILREYNRSVIDPSIAGKAALEREMRIFRCIISFISFLLILVRMCSAWELCCWSLFTMEWDGRERKQRWIHVARIGSFRDTHR